jgi:hypothetical protein
MEKFVGMEVEQGSGFIAIRQIAYHTRICKEAGIDLNRTVATPSEGGEQTRTPEKLQKAISFAKMSVAVMKDIGSLRYSGDNTRPDILYALGKAMLDESGRAAKRVMQYLWSTKDLGLIYRKDPEGTRFIAFADASFNQDPDGTSYYGFVIFPNRFSGAIEAVSKKIPHTVLSVAEAEHYAAGEVAKSIKHFRHLAEEISEPQSGPTDVNSDSESTLSMVDKTAYSALRRHFHPRRHALREWQRDGDINMSHVDSDYNVADIFTKVLSIERFTTLRDVLLGITPLATFYPKYADKVTTT